MTIPQFHKVRFLLEHPIAERVARDMDHILAQGWADSIGPEDLGHGHICVYDNILGGRIAKYGFKKGNLIHFYESEQQLRDLIKDDLSQLQVILLYHTHELDGKETDPNRNIKSMPDRTPEVVPAVYSDRWNREQMDISAMLKRNKNQVVTVYSRDINLAELFDVEFELNPKGQHLLAGGNRVDIFASGLVMPKTPKIITTSLDYRF